MTRIIEAAPMEAEKKWENELRPTRFEDFPGQDIIKELHGQFHLFSDLTEACRTYAEFFEAGTAHPQVVSVDKVLQEVKQAILAYNPECVIEVRSKSDNLEDLKKKMSVWIANGTHLAWLIDPVDKVNYIFRSNGSVDT